MTCEQAWTLFLATGLPEAYALYGLQRDGGRPQVAPTGGEDGGQPMAAPTDREQDQKTA